MTYLIPILTGLLLFITSFYALWVFFLAVMALRRARDAGVLSRLALVLGMPVLILGLTIDLFCNILLSVVLLELPQELTVTKRLKRHKYHGSGWRKSFAIAFGDHLLDDFDPSGVHL